MPSVGAGGITNNNHAHDVVPTLVDDPTHIRFNNNHIHTIQAILASTPPPAVNFTVDAVLTTKPQAYVIGENHFHDIQAILASTASGEQIKVDAILSARRSKTFTVDAYLKQVGKSFNFTVDGYIEAEFNFFFISVGIPAILGS